MTRTYCDQCGDQIGGLDHCTLEREIHGEDHPEFGVPYKKTLHADLCRWCVQCVADTLLARLTDTEAEALFADLPADYRKSLPRSRTP